ncbi:MAG: hypothetical protein RL000_1728 [Bacteroidota bacterium]|jgi:hypothetical protein
MAYGSGKRLGETIDPRLMMADFSGFERAGQIMGQGFANTGKQIGDTIKQRNENEKEIASKIKMAEAIKKAVPPLEGMADQVIRDLTNPDLSTSDKLRASAGINEAMQISLLGKQETRADAALAIQQGELALKKAELEANISAAKKGKLETFEVPVPGGTMLHYLDKTTNQLRPVSELIKQNIKSDSNTINEELLSNKKERSLFGIASDAIKRGLGLINQPDSKNIDPLIDKNYPDGLPILETPIVQEGNYPNYGTFEDATQGVSVDGTPGVLPPLESEIGFKPKEEEEKKIVNLDNGDQILIDKKGKRYNLEGRAFSKKSPIYRQKIAVDKTSIEEKITLLGEAKKLYEKGDKQGALNIMNAIGTGGLFGKTITMEELDSQMQQSGNQTASPEEEKLNELKSQFK